MCNFGGVLGKNIYKKKKKTDWILYTFLKTGSLTYKDLQVKVVSDEWQEFLP